MEKTDFIPLSLFSFALILIPINSYYLNLDLLGLAILAYTLILLGFILSFKEIIYSAFCPAKMVYEAKIQRMLQKISEIRENPYEKILNVFTFQRILVSSTALSVFILHFWLQWRYTYRYVHMGGGLAIIGMLNTFLERGITALLTPAFQINNYTGNPLFLLPVIDLFGYSPNAVRIALIGSLAASTALFFLAYYNLFNYRKALLGVLLLFSMSEYIYFRWFDGTYAIFLVSVIFYLYTQWIKSGEKLSNIYIYLTAFFGGLFFYFKTTVLYLLVGIGLATLLSKGRKVVDIRVLILSVVFLAGAAPFIIHNTANYEHIQTAGTGSSTISIGGPVNLSIDEALVGRYDQFGRWLRPDIYNLDKIDDANTTEEAFGYPFKTSNAPGTEIKGDINYRSIITGKNYDIHFFNGFHSLSFLLLIILPIIIWKGDSSLAIIFTSFFSLMIFLPSTSAFRAGHMNILVPFACLLYIQALDLVPNRFEKTRIYNILYLSTILLILGSIAFTASVLPTPGDPTNQEEVSLDVWGGDQKFYSEFSQLGIEGHVGTNSYKINVISNYFAETKSVYLIPNGVTFDEIIRLPTTGGHFIGVSDALNLEEYHYEAEKNSTLILRETLPCKPKKEFCGAETKKVIRNLNISESSFQRIELSDEIYLISSNYSSE